LLRGTLPYFLPAFFVRAFMVLSGFATLF